MMHNKRRYQVRDIPTDEELATELQRCTWCGCTGFRRAGYLWLNDAFSEDGAQEYAVIREADWQQVESITVSWCTPTELLGYIREMDRMADAEAWHTRCVSARNQIATPEQHGRCWLCE
jgi:hypothetical protein